VLDSGDEEGGGLFEVEGFIFANAEEDRDGTDVFTVEDFCFGLLDVVFSSLGDGC